MTDDENPPPLPPEVREQIAAELEALAARVRTEAVRGVETEHDWSSHVDERPTRTSISVTFDLA